MTETVLPWQIQWAPAPLITAASDPVFERKVKKVTGGGPSPLPYLLPVAWAAESMLTLATLKFETLSPEMKGLASLVVTQDNSCRFCYGASRAMMKMLGYGEGRIRKVEGDLLTAPLSESQRMALAYARGVSRAVPRTPPASADALRKAGWSREGVVSLTLLSALTVMQAKFCTALALRAPEALERVSRGPLLTLLSPVLGAMLRRKRAPWPVTPVEPGTHTPVDPIFVALEGLPEREALRRVVVDAMEPRQLPPRARGLVLAVIAAGLECRVCARGARTMLAREGFAEADVDRVVVHLSHPELSPLETRLVHFARETIRSRPEVLQARTEEIARELSREQLIELVMISALANCLGRLSVLVPE